MTFYAYLRKQASRADLIGALARDVILDKKQSHRQCRTHCRAVTYEGIRRHILREHHPDDSFLTALDAAYADYCAATEE